MDEINSARDRKNFFLYNDQIEDYEHPDAYFIIPSDLGYRIYHQYGCVGCYHFEIKGFAVPVPDPYVAKLLEAALGCNCQYNSDEVNLEQIKSMTGIEIESIQSEALARLKNGWYVATCNCD
jgi:hypothetical protein